MITITVCRRVCAAGECNLAELHVRGFAWVQGLSPSAFDHPVEIMAKITAEQYLSVADSMCSMATGRSQRPRGTRMGMCCRVARWTVAAEPFTWGLPQGVY